MIYGCIELFEYFLISHPGYKIYPIRCNGSAVESYFSTLRAIAGNNLSASNYASAAATAQLRKMTKPSRKRQSDYRKSHLTFRQHTLSRKHDRQKK